MLLKPFASPSLPGEMTGPERAHVEQEHPKAILYGVVSQATE